MGSLDECLGKCNRLYQCSRCRAEALELCEWWHVVTAFLWRLFVHTEQQVLNSPDCITATCLDPAKHSMVLLDPLHWMSVTRVSDNLMCLSDQLCAQQQQHDSGGGRRGKIDLAPEPRLGTVCVCVCVCVICYGF